MISDAFMWKESFLKYLAYERNYADDTICSYEIDLRKFEDYFKEVDGQLDYTTIDADVIRGWVMELIDAGYTATSVNRKLSTLRSFYRYLLRKGAVAVDPTLKVNGPKKKKPLPVFVKEADMDRLLDETDFGKGFEGIRNRMIVELFYETGIRLAELIGLTDVAVDLSGRAIKVTGKRNKQRLVPFGEELEKDLANYLSARSEYWEGACDAFFIRKGGKPMTRSGIYHIVKENLSKVVTLKKKSPHVLRHTFATSMLNHQAELEAVKELLGHESLTTTEVYTHTTFEELKKVYEQAHPRA